MNEQKKLNINHAALTYISTKSDEDFSALYSSLLAEYKRKLAYWSSTTFMADDHDMQELFDAMLLKTVEDIEKNGGDFVRLFHCKLTNRYKTLLRDLTTRRKHELYEVESENDEKAATFEIADEFNLEDHVIKKKADQWQLIDSLLNGADDTTTAIVDAFLAHPKPTATAIAKELGCHHSKVIRKLERLAGKFDSKQYGDYTDYLVAL